MTIFRNKKILILLSILAVLAYYRFIIFPVNNDIADFKKSIETKKREISNINEQIVKYKTIETAHQQLLNKYKIFPSSASLMNYLKTNLIQLNLKNKILKFNQNDIKNIDNYAAVSIYLQLKNLELPELTEFLNFIDNSGYALNYSKADITRNLENKFDCIFEINCLAQK